MARIENEFLAVEVDGFGAELRSVIEKSTEREWLWQGDAKWWNKRAPHLFPFIGVTKGGQYEHEGLIYPMTKHGFARDMDFELTTVEKTQLIYTLKSSDKTLKMYPFEFTLQIGYELRGKKLLVSHNVINNDTKTMYFSLGGHPAFNTNLLEESWALSFEREEILETFEIDTATGLIGKEKKRIFNEGGVVKLSPDLFKNDALVFEKLESSYVDLLGPQRAHLRFNFEAFPFMAFWSPMGPFICLEPWFGMADHVDHTGKLTDKYGVVSLEPNQVFEATYTIEIGF